MRSLVKHKLEKSNGKRAERSMLQPKAKPAVADKSKPVSKPPKRKS